MSGIFISYRRDDTGGYSGHLYERLSQRFGKHQIFMDVDAIPVGQDFVQFIDQRIRSCDVMIALIGKNWLKVTNRSGQRRLDDPDDFVRLEIEAALKRHVPVIPVLVGGAQVPAAQDLPSTIGQLAYLNAFEIYDRMFDESITRLISILSLSVKRKPIPQWWVAFLQYYRSRPVPFIVAAASLLIFIISLLLVALTDRTPETTSIAAPQAKTPPSNAPYPPKNELDAEEEGNPIETKEPAPRDSLPPVVEEARGAIAPGNFRDATGPRHARVLWKAAFQSLGEFVGAAGDGTLYFGTLAAIRDGTLQWAYNFSGRSVFLTTIVPDGRIWITQDRHDLSGEKTRTFVYNSRGEGGLITRQTAPPKEPEPPYVQYDGWRDGGYRGYTIKGKWYDFADCEFGAVSGSTLEGFPLKPRKWSVPIDGDCGMTTVTDEGDLLFVTKAGTLYSINSGGQLRWSYKAGCESKFLSALPDDDVVYSCDNMLHGLHSGKPRWDLAVDLGPEYPWTAFDKSNTLYLITKYGGSKTPSHAFLAVDVNGQLLWKFPFNSETRPLGLDKRGRLYLSSLGDNHVTVTVICLSD